MSHVGYGVGANALQLLNFMCVLYCLFTFLICCDAYIYAGTVTLKNGLVVARYHSCFSGFSTVISRIYLSANLF